MIDSKYEQMLSHSISLSDTYVNTHFSYRVDEKDLSEAATKRIFDYAIRMASDKDNTTGKDLWGIIGKNHHALLMSCLDRDFEGFWNITKKIAQTPNVLGFMNEFPYANLQAISECRKIDATHCIDKLISLSEYLTASPVLNPEQGHWQVVDPDFIPYLTSAYSRSDHIIPPPNAGGGAFGIQTNLGVYTTKDISGLYTGERINRLCELHAIERVCEIGGGLGFVAYYASKLRRVPYTLYDLPAVSIMQAHFLMRSLGEENVYLDGETYAHTEGVLLQPFWRVTSNQNENQLWINQDSLPEIDLNIAKSYIRKIAQTKLGWFLSINQEASATNWLDGEQHRVPSLTKNEICLRLQYRCRDFLRFGYVEELYSTGVK